MPKGKGQRDYEREIDEASKRMKKHPEYLRSARDSNEWVEFLSNIGIEPQIIESKTGMDFWEKVRSKISERELRFTVRELQERNVAPVVTYRSTKGKFTKVITDKPVVSYRNKETGRFVSRKSLEN